MRDKNINLSLFHPLWRNAERTLRVLCHECVLCCLIMRAKETNIYTFVSFLLIIINHLQYFIVYCSIPLLSKLNEFTINEFASQQPEWYKTIFMSILTMLHGVNSWKQDIMENRHKGGITPLHAGIMHADYHGNILVGKKQENCRFLTFLLFVTMETRMQRCNSSFKVFLYLSGCGPRNSFIVLHWSIPLLSK